MTGEEIVSAAFNEANEGRWPGADLDYTFRGESILIKHIDRAFALVIGGALAHAVHRDHPYSPDLCDACDAARHFLNGTAQR